MPYVTIADLPLSVQRHLPEHAQDIYLQAFNHAWESYAANPNREEIAHRVAWSAVKRRYRKAGDRWVALDETGF
jgi:cation transport regulator